MEVLKNIKTKILNTLEREFKFSKCLIHSKSYNKEFEVYIRQMDDFSLCVHFTTLNSYITLNREINSFFELQGIKYNLINVFIVNTIDDVESTYFQTEFYEEAIFIEESTGRIKTFNIHNVGFLNVLKNSIEGKSRKKIISKNNHLTITIITLSIFIYLVLGSINGSITSIRDEILVWAGAKMDILIKSGEYRRIFMSAFLHKDFIQLIVGTITLFFTGSIVEKNVGKINYLLIMFAGIFFGNFMSYLVNFSNVFGVGLYVVNYAMIGALFILAFKYREKVNKLFFIFIFSFIGINLLSGMILGNVDNFGSLVSFISGIVIMKVLTLAKTKK